MSQVFLGSEALRTGAMTRGRLRWRYRTIFPDVYVSSSAEPSLRVRTVGAWLWTGRRAIIAGRAAAALHGALWVDPCTPIEMIWSSARPPMGIVARNDKIGADEITRVGEMSVTTPARTAFDLSRYFPRHQAVPHLDALARATGVSASRVLPLAARYPRARGVRRVGPAIDLMDGGAQSPKESWLRLLVIDEGFPRPRTQIEVTDGFSTAIVDMGWEDLKIGLEYDGAQHQSDRRRFVHDIGRNELVRGRGWHDIHVVSEHTRAFIVHRVKDAFERRRRAL